LLSSSGANTSSLKVKVEIGVWTGNGYARSWIFLNSLSLRVTMLEAFLGPSSFASYY